MENRKLLSCDNSQIVRTSRLMVTDQSTPKQYNKVSKVIKGGAMEVFKVAKIKLVNSIGNLVYLCAFFLKFLYDL